MPIFQHIKSIYYEKAVKQDESRALSCYVSVWRWQMNQKRIGARWGMLMMHNVGLNRVIWESDTVTYLEKNFLGQQLHEWDVKMSVKWGAVIFAK